MSPNSCSYCSFFQFYTFLTLVGTYYFRVSMFCSFVEVEGNFVINSEKLQKLGWTFRPIEETLRDCVESYKTFGFLN
jgi:hypothetical protein